MTKIKCECGSEVFELDEGHVVIKCQMTDIGDDEKKPDMVKNRYNIPAILTWKCVSCKQELPDHIQKYLDEYQDECKEAGYL